jgi:uncharacterized protein (TIGR02001 family)
MRNTVFIPALLALLAAPLHAQEHAQETPPAGSVTFNAALASDYRYRGISQTRLQPALQGGADWTHEPTGLYAGTWLSTIKWTKDAGGGGDVEWDLYAGKRGRLTGAVTYDVGVLGYVYPANGLDRVSGSADANTAELYGQLGVGPAYVKYSSALTNLFGFTDSRHSGYLDVGANVDVGSGFTLNLHAGRQDVRHHDAASYTDYKIGVTKDVGFASVTTAFVGTNADETAYASPANGKFLGRKALVVSVGKTF